MNVNPEHSRVPIPGHGGAVFHSPFHIVFYTQKQCKLSKQLTFVCKLLSENETNEILPLSFISLMTVTMNSSFESRNRNTVLVFLLLGEKKVLMSWMPLWMWRLYYFVTKLVDLEAFLIQTDQYLHHHRKKTRQADPEPNPRRNLPSWMCCSFGNIYCPLRPVGPHC